MASSLPDYLAAARPVPQDKRAPWYLNVAQTYASVMLWYVFWSSLAGAGGTFGGTLSAGIWPLLLAILVGGLICYFCFYLVPGLLGMKTGLPLYVVGTSTYGAQGGLIMPGFLMGILQFGWLGVNAFMVAEVLCKCFGVGLTEGGAVQFPNPAHALIAIVFAGGAAFMGLKGIQYVARVASLFPVIPLVILVVLFVSTIGGVGKFDSAVAVNTGKTAYADAVAKAEKDHAEAVAKGEDVSLKAPDKPGEPMPAGTVILVVIGVVVGFFATAGAAGADLAMNSRNANDVQWGGLVGIALMTLIAGGLAVLVVAGTYGAGKVPASELKTYLDPLHLMSGVIGDTTAKVFLVLLAISAFPGGCFSAYIAATSFKTTMPKVNPYLSVGLGTLVSIFLAVTGLAAQVVPFFLIIGASFGPICGAMAADYLLSGGRWAGPRAGFNPAGWISWAVGFAVGTANFYLPLLKVEMRVPCEPVVAFLVGFVLYYALAKAGMESKSLGALQSERL